MNEPGGRPTSESATQDGAAPDPAPTCPWCGALATAEATQCAACGAALAQRESIGDLRIPGLTSVDPALEDFDKRPLHLRGPSPSQGMAPALIVGAMAGGPIGLVAIGGVAAVAGAEFLAAGRGGAERTDLADLGKPSEVLLKALENEAAAPTDDKAAAPEEGPTPAATADDGRSIWRDLPPENHDAGPDTDIGPDRDPEGAESDVTESGGAQPG